MLCTARRADDLQTRSGAALEAAQGSARCPVSTEYHGALLGRHAVLRSAGWLLSFAAAAVSHWLTATYPVTWSQMSVLTPQDPMHVRKARPGDYIGGGRRAIAWSQPQAG